MEVMRLEKGDIEAELLPEAGARMHRLRVRGHDVLRTPDDPATHRSDPFFWGAYVMAPWANRLTAEPTEVAGRVVDLESNFPDGSAIHGQVYDRAWERDGDLLWIEGGGDGWPWRYRVECRVSLTVRSLRLAYALENRSEAPMPAGLGTHPWWRKPVEVAIPARAVYASTTDSPASAEPVTGRFDRRGLEPLPTGLDAAWTDLARPAVRLRWPDEDVELELRAEAPDPHVVAASPSDMDAVAVEVQTHAPQGLRRLLRGEPGGLALLDAGERLALVVELSVE